MRVKTLLLATLLTVQTAFAELPNLGGANTSSAQLQHEYELGKVWVRLIKSQTSLDTDPVINAYIKQLCWRLVPYSALLDRRLEVLVIDKQETNAFAAPGGIIGIHTGLLSASRHEDELASVIAHEFAHLSERHYAQQQNASDKNAPLILAGMLGGLLLSGINPNLGAAAINGTIGASAAAQLSFSRQNELQADQAGMKILIAAGFDPQAMPRMFSLLQNANRFAGNQIPEFLRTHPVTQSRIVDSTNRAAEFPRTQIQIEDPDSYLIAKVRAQLHFHEPKQEEISEKEVLLYDFYQATNAANQASAEKAFSKLPESLQNHPWVTLGKTELSVNLNHLTQAKTQIDELYALYPDDHAIKRATADIWVKTGAHKDALQLYRELIRETPSDPDLWYQTAEIYGLLNETSLLHRARIEYFLTRGDIDLALRQVEFARRDAKNDKAQLSWLNQREAEIFALREDMDRLLK